MSAAKKQQGGGGVKAAGKNGEIPVSDEDKDLTRVYLFHGVMLSDKTTSDNRYAECPFCQREGKFFVNVTNGKFQCKVCQEEGNVYGFLKTLYEESRKATKPHGNRDLERLAKDRRLRPETLLAWGCAEGLVTGQWLVPGFNEKGVLNNLYQRTEIRSENRHALFSTPTCKHGLHGLDLFDPKKSTTYFLEGVWDAMALWEAVAEHMPDLFEDANFLATPSASVFNPRWASVLAGQDVVLMYDNDHPQVTPRGTEVKPVGFTGMVKAASILMKSETPPASIRYLHWGDGGYTKQYPHRYDVRDHLTKGVVSSLQKSERLDNLMGMVRDVPESWRHNLDPRTMSAIPDDQPKLELIHCETFDEVEEAFKEALEWTPGLRGGLAFNMAIILSTELQNDQVWGILMSPPSTAKTTLAEALATAVKYVFPKDDFTGLSSGYRSEGDGTENHSLIGKLKNMTLLIKDGDTLLRNPNLDKILSEFRALYDRVFRTNFRNGMGRNWEGQNTTVIINGTSTMMELDAADKGARFLQYCIMDGIDPGLERKVGWKVARSVLKNISAVSNGRPETRESPEMTKAKQLTGGYVTYIRPRAAELVKRYEDTTPDELLERCIEAGEFVAFMRSRPPRKQDEIVDREFSARLIKQHVKLMCCIAAVLNKEVVDDEVMGMVNKVAKDTARGKMLDLSHVMMTMGNSGATTETLCKVMGTTPKKIENLLEFACRIEVVEPFRKKYENIQRWRLTDRIVELYRSVFGMVDEDDSDKDCGGEDYDDE